MGAKHLVCHGALCMCNFGTAPDKLSVKTHEKEFVNDADGTEKMIASTKDINKTFEKNTFGSCSKQNNNPCQATVTEWKGFYEKVTLENEGQILIEDSKATCPIGCPDCIKITFHGQTAQLSKKNAENIEPEVHAMINPMMDLNEVTEDDTPDYY